MHKKPSLSDHASTFDECFVFFNLSTHVHVALDWNMHERNPFEPGGLYLDRHSNQFVRRLFGDVLIRDAQAWRDDIIAGVDNGKWNTLCLVCKKLYWSNKSFWIRLLSFSIKFLYKVDPYIIVIPLAFAIPYIWPELDKNIHCLSLLNGTYDWCTSLQNSLTPTPHNITSRQSFLLGH